MDAGKIRLDEFISKVPAVDYHGDKVHCEYPNCKNHNFTFLIFYFKSQSII